MEYRAPSSLRAGKDGVLRRRSSVYAPQDDVDDQEEPDKLQRRPTVLLVRQVPLSSRSFTPLLAPAFTPFCMPSSAQSTPTPPSPPTRSPVVRGLGLGLIGSPVAADAVQRQSDQQFSTVPLTPRPDALTDALSPSSVSTIPSTSLPTPMPPPDFMHRPDGPHRAHSDATTIPFFPTPDFGSSPRFLGLFPRGLSYLSHARPFFSRSSTAHHRLEEERSSSPCSNDPPLPTLSFPRPPGLLSMFPRGLSYFSWNHGSQTASRRPQSVRSESERSTGSGSSGTSNATSIDTGHYALIKEIGTTDRFTHKWPRPQSLRTTSADDATEGLLEDGRGLSMPVDSVESWTRFKWCLLLSVCTVFAYGTAALICALMTWFRTWDLADVMYVADNDILILITLAGSILVFTSLVGLSGLLLNSRPILAVYTVLLFFAFASVVAIGYTGYKRTTFALDQKLNFSWSQYYTVLGRLRIQDALHCCGFYSPLHEATPSPRCFPRTALPGCKGKLYRFERANLATVWLTAFSLVPLHLLNVLVALLCVNHVTERFGRGITPKQYRLTNGDVLADAENIRRRRTVVSGRNTAGEGLPGRDSSRRTFRKIADHDDLEDTVPFLSYEGGQ